MSTLMSELADLKDRGRDRLVEIDEEIQALQVEKSELEQVLGLTSGRDSARPHGEATKVVREILADGEPHSARDIEAAVPGAFVYQLLARMVQQGVAERTSPGVYRALNGVTA